MNPNGSSYAYYNNGTQEQEVRDFVVMADMLLVDVMKWYPLATWLHSTSKKLLYKKD